MTMNFLGWLSVGVIVGIAFAMFLAYLNHKKAMKKLAVEALKYEYVNKSAETDKP